jgi:hypothetical protein
MDTEKTLEEALDEFDRWEDQLCQAIEGMSPQEAVEYFRQSAARLEQQTGKRLKFSVPEKPPAATA